MKNKLLSIISSVFALVCLSGCETLCEHDFIDATCTTPKTCTLCNEVEGEALGHSWNDATCTEAKTCSLCNKKEGEALGHNYTSATCFEPKICTVCNHSEGEALNHTVEDDTCTVCLKEGIFYRNDISKEIKDLVELVTNEVDDNIKTEINKLYIEYYSYINKETKLHKLDELKEEFMEKMYDLIPLANGLYAYDLNEFEDVRYAKKLMREYGYRNNTFGIPLSKHYSINLNSATQEEWDYFFGEEGTEKDRYLYYKFYDDEGNEVELENKHTRKVKPFLSNNNFIKGLSHSINKELIQSIEKYKDVEKPEYLYIGMDDYDYYDYDVEKARKFFKIALDEMISEGTYDVTNIDEPILLTIDFIYDFSTQSDAYKYEEDAFNILEKCFEEAFNDESVTNGKFKLDVVGIKNITQTGNRALDYCYVGHFDMSLCIVSWSHSGPFLSFENKTPYNLGLSYSIDTNNAEIDCIVYKGERYSYDAFVSSSKSGGYPKVKIINGNKDFNYYEE